MALHVRQLRRGHVLAMATLSLLILHDLWVGAQMGGNAWQQGDWLINSHAVHVRRGLVGSAILLLSDLMGVHPVVTVLTCQLAITTSLLGLLLAVASRERETLPVWVVTAAPSFPLLFWTLDPGAGARKEILAYLALALLLFVAAFRRWPRTLSALACIVLAVGMLGHETNLLLMPPFLACLMLTGDEDLLGIRWRLLLGCVVVLVGLAALTYSALHPRVDHADLVCRPLLARQVDPALCEGPIAWLDRGHEQAWTAISRKYDSSDVSLLLVAYVAVLCPLVWLHSHYAEARVLNGGLALTGLPLLILYPIALDWGRWISCHVTSWSLLFLTMSTSRRLTLVRPTSSHALMILVLASATWKLPHTGAPEIGGLLWCVARKLGATP